MLGMSQYFVRHTLGIPSEQEFSELRELGDQNTFTVIFKIFANHSSKYPIDYVTYLTFFTPGLKYFYRNFLQGNAFIRVVKPAAAFLHY